MEAEPTGDPGATRVALNETAFREMNEAIEAKADALAIGGLLPFLCECADERCTTIVQLTRAEYEEVRAGPTRFVITAGHERAAEGFGQVLERHDRYFVVAKVAEAADLAAAADPRRSVET